ncbi:MAG: glucose-6-phosphate isomerase [Clostridia bacterium]|nr:glucose-6-phosphate isomerase [Clostridia bacterium]
MTLSLNTKFLGNLVNDEDLKNISNEVYEAQKLLGSRSGAGNDFLGWVDLPEYYDKEEFERIKKAAKKIQDTCDVFIVIGIGGSYLGARAAIEFVKSPVYNNISNKKTPDVYFAGNSISASALSDLLKICEGKDICINVVSKSGTTTEPAIAFRVFRNLLEEKYGKDGAKERIFSTTDKAKGTLKKFSDENGYETFVVPDDVGGRFSVLTAVGLLPIAVAGIDIDAMMKGAQDARKAYADCDIDTNDCLKYVAIRNVLYRKNKSVEILAAYEPAVQMLCEWWKQLFGESEGKDGKGIFPSSVIFSTDLHSLGQFIQDGSRIMFETVLDIKNSNVELLIPNDPANVDKLNFLAGKDLDYVNHTAMLGTLFAHSDGNVPNIVLELKDRSEYSFGYLVYFFELACAISGYTLGVNPFNQPGVESYKKNMFALLGKEGYEELAGELSARINK